MRLVFFCILYVNCSVSTASHLCICLGSGLTCTFYYTARDSAIHLQGSTHTILSNALTDTPCNHAYLTEIIVKCVSTSRISWPLFKVQPTTAYKILQACATKLQNAKLSASCTQKLQRENCQARSRLLPRIHGISQMPDRPRMSRALGPLQKESACWEHDIVGQVFLPL